MSDRPKGARILADHETAQVRERLASYCALHLVHDSGCAIAREALDLAERYAGQLSKETVAAWLLQTEAGRSLRGEIAKPWQERAEQQTKVARVDNLAWFEDARQRAERAEQGLEIQREKATSAWRMWDEACHDITTSKERAEQAEANVITWQDKALKAERRVAELKAYLGDRCAQTCSDPRAFPARRHEPNCPAADLNLRSEERAE